ncbi:hypothetical protein PPL_11959 [Heterostelium album PN500]|uniref:FNIP repeat-containing protein n=1 Tax=Heterostelium pallidum (strain ATCC 26659 / Pp 5 / PN500) TaxID=670386 RepID=D3BUY7_HETP5|nr:hypothetical protein PPL_11959 [Heterostelium album PN500]EFA74925.1 hypothetical protein PPL_11959 [Heterostelium album PN500]|eukprot:XP_020427059.1 hypothetical protein PPL_11959 [Heterostelium album PN500]
MPTSIKLLDLGECEFQIDEIFPETLQYHFELLEYSKDTIISTPSNLKIDKLIIDGIIDQETCSLTPPSGITSISLDMLFDHNESFLRIHGNDQTTLKKLRLPHFNIRPRASIPNTIEELDIGNNSLYDSLDLIKSIDSIKTLYARWFNDRDKYLIFNIDNIVIKSINDNDITHNHKHFNLPSYNNIFNKSIQTKTDCSLYFGPTDFNRKYDFYYDTYTDLKSIPSYISTISLPDEITDQEYLYQLLLESQSVTTLNGCNTLKYGLPKTIKTLSLGYKFNELLVKGSLPSSLEEVILNSFDQAIQAGVLPEGLLEFSSDYQFEFQPGVFPSSLKTLILSFYKKPFKVGVLPENLECLYYSGASTPLEDGVLPKSLKQLIDVPMTWLQTISSLPNLEILRFYEENQDILTINLDLLPSSLKVLEFKRYRLIGTMPTSITSLNLGKCEFQFEEIFPETLQYHFESLQYSKKTIVSIPSNLKIVKLIIDGTSFLENNSLSLPSGITSISLEMSLKHKEAFLRIDGNDQTTLKKLRLPYFNVRPRVFIPNTIEELDIGNNSLNDSLDLIKSIDSIKTFVFSKLSNIEIISPENLNTINNIIYLEYSNNIKYRKLDDNFYLMFGCLNETIIARIFHQSKLSVNLHKKMK